MRRISAPRCWSRVTSSRGSLCGADPADPRMAGAGRGGYTIEQFEVDWAQQRVRCPQGKWSVAWWDQGTRARSRPIFVELPLKIARPVPPGRSALERSSRAAWGYRPRTSTRRCERPRCGIAVRRASRAINNEPGSNPLAGCPGLWAAARQISGFRENTPTARGHRRRNQCGPDRGMARRAPRAKTRTSRFAALAPACAIPSGTGPEDSH